MLLPEAQGRRVGASDLISTDGHMTLAVEAKTVHKAPLEFYFLCVAMVTNKRPRYGSLGGHNKGSNLALARLTETR